MAGSKHITRSIWCPSAHAEINALKMINKLNRRSRLVMVVVRAQYIDGQMILFNSKPCKNCVETMSHFGVQKVVYSNECGELTQVKVVDLLQSDDLVVSSGFRMGARLSRRASLSRRD
eukprot:TRINITY_DN794_c0_g1_i2.p1 TRINITY_DN794_c0_g1~~TRINITY_DN794_c0_g1_i2.p1  ORF type:complete len:118 (-),score=2.03 TRINITY_DN794_c0_g1_i2:31-384(-)